MSFYELLKKIWRDEHGVVVSAEIVLVTTILVLGSIVGLTQLQLAISHELHDLANTVSTDHEISAYDHRAIGNQPVYRGIEHIAVPRISGDGDR